MQVADSAVGGTGNPVVGYSPVERIGVIRDHVAEGSPLAWVERRRSGPIPFGDSDEKMHRPAPLVELVASRKPRRIASRYGPRISS
jgi:hypothetical protein